MVDANDSVMAVMSWPPETTKADGTLRAVARDLFEQNVGALLVNDGSNSVGVVSERDVVFALSRGADPDEVWCSDIMTDDALTIEGRAPIAEAAEYMAQENVRHLVVTDSAKPVGVVSVRDLLACLEY